MNAAFSNEDIAHAARFLGATDADALRWLNAEEAARKADEDEDAAYWAALQGGPELPDAWLHDGEWARVRDLYIYPRDGKFHIGKLSGARDYRDVETGFDNMQAAIDHARWMAS